MPIREIRFVRLVRHFFAGFMDNDLLMSAENGMQNALSQVLGLAVAPGLFYCLLITMKYGAVRYPRREIMAWDDRLLFVHCAMIVTGLLTVVEWDSLFPDQRDYQILTPLPLAMRLVFLAKVSSVLLLLVIFWAAGNIGPAILFPLVALTGAEVWFSILQHIGAQLAATFAASAFVFLLAIGLQGLLLNLLPPRWFRRVSVYAQLAALLALVLGFLLMPLVLANAGMWIRAGRPAMYLVPSFWYLGLYQVLAGRATPAFAALAALGVKALGAAAAISALAYFAAYRRHARRALESFDAGRSGTGFLSRAVDGVCNRFVLRHPLERACFHFMRATLLRSQIHRLLLAAYLGVGFALALCLVGFARSTAGRPTPELLSVQLVLSFFVLCGMRFVFTVPAELRANWVFQVAEPFGKSPYGAGVRKCIFAFGVFPVLAGLLPLHAFFWGWAVAGAHLLYGAALCALLVEALMMGFEKIPFTCTYLPGKANVKALWPLYLLLFWAYAYAMANLEAGLLARPLRYAAFCAGVAALTVVLRWYRHRQLGRGFHFLFEDVPDPAVRTLDIGY